MIGRLQTIFKRPVHAHWAFTRINLIKSEMKNENIYHLLNIAYVCHELYHWNHELWTPSLLLVESSQTLTDFVHRYNVHRELSCYFFVSFASEWKEKVKIKRKEKKKHFKTLSIPEKVNTCILGVIWFAIWSRIYCHLLFFMQQKGNTKTNKSEVNKRKCRNNISEMI